MRISNWKQCAKVAGECCGQSKLIYPIYIQSFITIAPMQEQLCFFSGQNHQKLINIKRNNL